MTRRLQLTKQEETLCELLLDVSSYVGAQAGYTTPELRFTGGWVRDKLLGIKSKDIDIGISSMTGYRFGTLMKQYLDDPKAQKKFGQEILGSLAKIEANPEKSKHLETVTTKLLGFELDLVNLRKETYVDDSRNPTMEFGSPEDDALRRDSTINALFYNLATKEIEDFSGQGLHDMKLKVIRTPLSPYQTFKDDPLRVLRCIRFASKLNYSIDAEAERSVSDPAIKEALRIKISRERVGIEIGKMLEGPHPCEALHFIDRLCLYDTIFTDPAKKTDIPTLLAGWRKAYTSLQKLIDSTTSAGTQEPRDLQLIKIALLSEKCGIYRAWLLCALVPWARNRHTGGQLPRSKPPLPPAAVVGREGLKINNETLSIVKNAVLHMDEIIASKDALSNREMDPVLPTKRKQYPLRRDVLGMAIRRWGPHWRSSSMLALLTQIAESNGVEDWHRIIKDYATWLSYVEELGLSSAYKLESIVNGTQLKEAFGIGSGQWLKTALDMSMEWQLLNPNETDPRSVIEAVKLRYEGTVHFH